MRTLLTLSLIAIGLVGCAKTEETAAPSGSTPPIAATPKGADAPPDAEGRGVR